MDLSAQLFRMLFQHIFLLLFNAAFLLFHFLLFVDNSKEFITFLFRLLGESLLSLKELNLACMLHIFKDSLLVLEISPFPLAGDSFTFFECTLCSQRVYLRLSISCLLLELT